MNTDKAQPPFLVRAALDVNQLRRFGARLGALFCAVCVLLPSPAEAQCREWDVSGQWKLQQGDLVVFVNLRQRDKVISGTAQYTRRESEAEGGFWSKKTLNGSVAGTVDGSNVRLDMDWDDGSGGIYTGVIGQTGMIKGRVIIDKNNPSKTWAWHSMQPMKCADEPTQPAPAASPKRVISHKGKGSTTPAAPAQPAAQENPVLTAKPLIVIPSSGKDYGYSHLSWDAGKGHPNAELWLKVDSGAWTVAQKQAKDSFRPFKIERGKTYLFSLRDGSGELRSVTVRCQPSADDTADANEGSGSTEPFLRASREVVPASPGQDYGWTQLSWDGGDRRAKLLVTVDDEASKVASNEPTGSKKPFRIERGKTYVFMLASGGQELGSVTVRGE